MRVFFPVSTHVQSVKSANVFGRVGDTLRGCVSTVDVPGGVHPNPVLSPSLKKAKHAAFALVSGSMRYFMCLVGPITGYSFGYGLFHVRT